MHVSSVDLSSSASSAATIKAFTSLDSGPFSIGVGTMS